MTAKYQFFLPHWVLALLCTVSLSKIQETNAHSIVLDLHSQQTPEWLEVSCVYNEDYHDLWVFGCPANLAGTDDVFPSKKGFWTPCSAQRCEIHYYASKMPQAKTITLGMYLQGSPQIIVSSKYSPLDDTFSNQLGEVSGSEENKGWIETTIDLTFQTRALVLNFTLISFGDDVLLLDKIILDFENDVATTTVNPTPSTTTEGADGYRIVLDLDSQQTSDWLEVSCAYKDDYNDLWVFGCPANLNGTDDVFPSKKGFWTPCSAQRCEIHFYNSQMPQAKNLKLDMYLRGSPQILVSSKYSPLDETFSNQVGGVSGSAENKGWIEATIDLTSQSRALVLNFTLISVGDDILLLDKIILDYGNDFTPTTVDPTAPTTTVDPTAPTTTVDPTGTTSRTTTPPSGASSFTLAHLSLPIIVFTGCTTFLSSLS